MLIVGIGGFIGSVLRFLVGRYFQFNVDSVFPWATLIVNLLGSFVIGLVYGISEKGNVLSPQWRIFLTVGLCGGFTTFSSFSNDALLLMQGKEWLRFAAYSGFSFFFGLMAAYLGRTFMKLF